MDVYIDITQFERGRANTGVQRVTREFLKGALTDTDTKVTYIVVAYNISTKKLQILPNDEVLIFLRETATYQFKSRKTIEIESLKPSNRSIFFDLDAAWNSPLQRHILYPILKNNGFHLFTFIHDLVPILIPEVVHKTTRINFNHYMASVYKYSDMAIFNSASTEKDFVEHKKEENIDRYIAQRVVGLGSDLDNSALGAIEEQYKKILDSRYLLSVGTIEPRKNHAYLLDAFDVLSEKYPDLNLVIIGTQGWDVGPLVKRINSHPLKDTRLFWLTGVDDNALMHFYDNAFMVTYLSKYEGYGLPIAEALQWNNITIACKNSSMYEVGRECTDYIEYNSLKEVVDIVSLYYDNEELYNYKKKFISNNFYAISWDTFSASIFDILNNIDKSLELRKNHLTQLQWVFISIDGEALQGTISAIDKYVDFVKEFIIVTAPQYVSAFKKIESGHKISVINENDILGKYADGFSTKDHQSKNWLLRTSLLNLENLDDEFIMLDDDNRPLKTIDLEKYISADGKYNAYYFYSLLEWHHTHTEYDLGQHASKDILTEKNYELLSYSSHCPQIINKTILKEVVAEFFEIGLEQPLDEWSIYFNYANSRYPLLFDKRFFETMNWPHSPYSWDVDFNAENISFENYYAITYQNGLFKQDSTLEEKVEKKQQQLVPYTNTIDMFKENSETLRDESMVHGQCRFEIDDIEVYIFNVPYYVVIQQGANLRLRLNYKVINRLEKDADIEIFVQLNGKTRNVRKFANLKKAAYFESIIEFPIIGAQLKPGVFDITLNLVINGTPVYPEGSPFLIKLIMVTDKQSIQNIGKSKISTGRDKTTAERLKDGIRDIPLIGWFSKWLYNLYNITKLRQIVHNQQKQINTLLLYNRQHIDRYNSLEQRLQNLSTAEKNEE
jgi:glycosyltransferase involved in cell wall biosynthesis